MGEPFVLNKNKVKKMVTDFENKNSTKLKDFKNNELTFAVHKDVIDRCNRIEDKIDEHINWGQNEDQKIHKILSDHDVLFQKIVNVLPAKGFCGKVTNSLELDKEVTLADKVDIIWHDRRWIKYILLAVIALGGGNIVIQMI